MKVSVQLSRVRLNRVDITISILFVYFKGEKDEPYRRCGDGQRVAACGASNTRPDTLDDIRAHVCVVDELNMQGFAKVRNLFSMRRARRTCSVTGRTPPDKNDRVDPMALSVPVVLVTVMPSHVALKKLLTMGSRCSNVSQLRDLDLETWLRAY